VVMAAHCKPSAMFSYPGKNDSRNSITNSIIVIRKKFISNEKCDFTFLAQKNTHTHTHIQRPFVTADLTGTGNRSEEVIK